MVKDRTGKLVPKIIKREFAKTLLDQGQPVGNKFGDIMFLPCGQCEACRAQHARTWANRLLMELQYHDSAYFVTLTYDNDHVPISRSREEIPHMTLDKRDCQLFMKKLRKAFPNDKLRYFLSGEYGDQTHRPHYHMILFGLHLVNSNGEVIELERCGENEFGNPYFRCEALNDIWQNGNVLLADVTWESCCYVAQYCMKKLKGEARHFYEDVNIQPPFVLMSRKPGIGYQWFEDHPEFVEFDKIHIATATGPRSFRPPRYFEKQIEKLDPLLAEQRAALRQRAAVLGYENKTLNTSLDYFDQLEVEVNAHSVERASREMKELIK